MRAGVGLTAFVMALALAACTVGPDFVRPDDPKIPSWRNAQANDGYVRQTADPDPRWWNGFNDPLLTELIETAIKGNLDLQQAVLRVIEARQNVVVAQAAGLPTLNGTESYRREQFGLKGPLESSGVYRQLNALADQSSPLNQYAPGLGTQASSLGTGLVNGLTRAVGSLSVWA